MVNRDRLEFANARENLSAVVPLRTPGRAILNAGSAHATTVILWCRKGMRLWAWIYSIRFWTI